MNTAAETIVAQITRQIERDQFVLDSTARQFEDVKQRKAKLEQDLKACDYHITHIKANMIQIHSNIEANKQKLADLQTPQGLTGATAQFKTMFEDAFERSKDNKLCTYLRVFHTSRTNADAYKPGFHAFEGLTEEKATGLNRIAYALTVSNRFLAGEPAQPHEKFNTDWRAIATAMGLQNKAKGTLGGEIDIEPTGTYSVHRLYEIMRQNYKVMPDFETFERAFKSFDEAEVRPFKIRRF